MNSASCCSVIAAQLADLDASQLAGPEKVIDLVATDMQHLGYLLNRVCPQWLSPPPASGRVKSVARHPEPGWKHLIVMSWGAA